MNAVDYSRNYSLEPQPLILPAMHGCCNCSTPTTSSFRDSDGDLLEVSGDGDAIDLLFTDSDNGEVTSIAFYKRDAAKIIELIAGAAK